MRPPAWPGVEIRHDPGRSGAAPLFRCARCHDWIGKRRPVAVVIADSNIPVIICVRCADADPAIRLRFGTRAGTARRLGLWPRRKGGSDGRSPATITEEKDP